MERGNTWYDGDGGYSKDGDDDDNVSGQQSTGH